jgi:hypothetical protein
MLGVSYEVQLELGARRIHLRRRRRSFVAFYGRARCLRELEEICGGEVRN